MNILHIVGARPNFMKVAPVIHALAARHCAKQTLVHTGQHYDFNMSEVFFQQLGISSPDVNLLVGSDSHAQQTAQVISRLEPVILEWGPDLVLVYGDVNSTIAAALVCSKLMVPMGHVEAGLRSFDRSMPEEINRVLTDQVSNLLFTPSQDGNDNLLREGVSPENIHLVGNVMIDTLIRMLPLAQTERLDDQPPRFILVTLHRPSNVDDSNWLAQMLNRLSEIASTMPVLFPVHPRTRQRIADAGLMSRNNGNLRLIDPLPYIRFLALQQRAVAVVTDSGGIQEETTFLGVPCLTVRENTERPITLTSGTNLLVGRNLDRLQSEVEAILAGKTKKTTRPPLWDGHAAERIATAILGC
jgi:UDP-N-acetylglucosamine 2-epimerase (non-hydrolysing)